MTKYRVTEVNEDGAKISKEFLELRDAQNEYDRSVLRYLYNSELNASCGITIYEIRDNDNDYQRSIANYNYNSDTFWSLCARVLHSDKKYIDSVDIARFLIDKGEGCLNNDTIRELTDFNYLNNMYAEYCKEHTIRVVPSD